MSRSRSGATRRGLFGFGVALMMAAAPFAAHAQQKAGGSRRQGSARPADGRTAPARHLDGRSQGAGDDHRIRLDDLRPLRAIRTHDLRRSSRRNISTPARCAMRCANSRSIRWPPPPPCWRAARATSARPWSSCCSSSRRTGPSSTIRCRPCATPSSRPAWARRRSTPASTTRPCSTRSTRSATRPRRNSASTPRRLSSSTARRNPAKSPPQMLDETLAPYFK